MEDEKTPNPSTRSLSPATRPSKLPPGVAQAIGGMPGTIIAMLTALAGAIGAYQTYQDGQNTSRATYDTLRLQSEQQSLQIAALQQGQADLRRWMEAIAYRLERASVVPSPLPPVPEPIIPPSIVGGKLPAFDHIEKK